jgi:hypothetical protein
MNNFKINCIQEFLEWYDAYKSFENVELGCQQGKIDKKSGLPKVQLKNETIFYRHKKVYSKYFEIKIYKHKALYLVYGKLDTKFE